MTQPNPFSRGPALAWTVLSLLFLATNVFAQAQTQLERRGLENKQVPQAAVQSQDVYVKQVLSTAQQGLSEDVIIAKIRKTNRAIDLSLEEMVSLKKAGLSDNIIKVLLDPTAPTAAVTSPTGGVVVPTVGGTVVIGGGKASGATPAAGISEGAIEANLNSPDAPHDSGIYMYVEKNDVKRMVGLERASYQGQKTGGVFAYAATGGIMKAKIKAVIPGPRASVRSSEPRPTFYFYFEEKSAGLGKSGFGGQTVSNPTQFALLKLEVKKGNRETVTGKVGLGSASSGTDEKAMVAFRSERLRPGVYRVIPTANLEPGEYCFLASGSGATGAATARDIFDFGVTPAE